MFEVTGGFENTTLTLAPAGTDRKITRTWPFATVPAEGETGDEEEAEDEDWAMGGASGKERKSSH